MKRKTGNNMLSLLAIVLIAESLVLIVLIVYKVHSGYPQKTPIVYIPSHEKSSVSKLEPQPTRNFEAISVIESPGTKPGVIYPWKKFRLDIPQGWKVTKYELPNFYLEISKDNYTLMFLYPDDGGECVFPPEPKPIEAVRNYYESFQDLDTDFGQVRVGFMRYEYTPEYLQKVAANFHVCQKYAFDDSFSSETHIGSIRFRTPKLNTYDHKMIDEMNDILVHNIKIIE